MTGVADAELFERERGRLIGVAYRLLGTPDDAEDVVQEAWLRYARTTDDIENPAGWLTTVVTRLGLDRLKSAHTRREQYVGPWLSEPWFETLPASEDPAESLLLHESVTLGFLAVLERLSPLERAVFILHRIFETPLDEVASVIERTPAATRQLSKRANDHVAEGRPRFTADESDVKRLTTAVLEAALTGDIQRLESHLADDVIHLSDGGPNHRAARAPIVGPTRVARFFIGIAKSAGPGMEFHQVRANGQSALYTTVHGEPFMLMVSNVVDGRLARSFAVRNPDKLAAFHRAWLHAS